MKKLLALLLISTLVVSEELEYPVELTCELGASIIYFNLDEEDNSMTVIHNPFMAAVKNKKYKLKRIEIKEDTIGITKWIGGNPHLYTINRFNLKIDERSLGYVGQCIKGFKEYTEKKI